MERETGHHAMQLQATFSYFLELGVAQPSRRFLRLTTFWEIGRSGKATVGSSRDLTARESVEKSVLQAPAECAGGNLPYDGSQLNRRGKPPVLVHAST